MGEVKRKQLEMLSKISKSKEDNIQGQIVDDYTLLFHAYD